MDERIQIVLEARDLMSGEVRRITGSLSGLDGVQGRVKASTVALGSALGILAADAIRAVTAAIGDSIGELVNFERAMLNVNSIAKVDEAAFDAMKDAVVELSTEVPQSASVLAAGLYDIQSSGFAGAEGVEVLEAAAKAASAGLTDTATSAKGLTAILNAYGLESGEAARISDLMFKVVDRGVVTFEELAGNIGKTTALAAPLGVAVEEVGAALAVMTRKGIDAENATTQLNAIMANLLKPSNEAKELAEELGLGWDTQALAGRGLSGVLADLVDKTGGNHEQMATLLGDARAIRGAFVLAADGGAELADELEVMRGAAGATDTALSYQKQGLAYQLGILGNRIDAAVIRIGDRLLPVITELVEGIGRWIDENEEVIDQVGDVLAAALDVAVTGVGALFDVLGPLVEVLDDLKPVLIAIAGVIGFQVTLALWALVPAAIAAVASLAPIIATVLAIAAAVKVTADAVNNFAMDFGEMGEELRRIAEETGASYDRVKDLTKLAMSELGMSFGEATRLAEAELSALPEMTYSEMLETIAVLKEAQTAAGEAGKAAAGAAVDGWELALRSGNEAIRGAAADMMAPLPEEVQAAEDAAVDIATTTPGDIAAALMSEEELTEAAEELRERIVDPFRDADRRLFIEAELASGAIREGLRSDDTDVVAETVAYVNDLLDQYELMAPGALAAGELINPALAEGLDGNVQEAIDAAQRVADQAGLPLDFSEMADTFGYNTMLAYAEGVRRAEMQAFWASHAVAMAVRRGIQAESPPVDTSPLHEIDIWGERTIAAYADGLLRSAGLARDAALTVASETARAFDGLPVGPGDVALSPVAIGGQPIGSRAGSQAGLAGLTLHLTYAPQYSIASPAEAQQFARAVLPELIREMERQSFR